MLKYEDLTEEDKKKICNGCGGKGSIIKPPHRIFFKASCNHHDYGYYKGGTERDRLTCDTKFYNEMKRDCKCLPFYQKLRYVPWCLIYFKSVRIFGKKYFNYS